MMATTMSHSTMALARCSTDLTPELKSGAELAGLSLDLAAGDRWLTLEPTFKTYGHAGVRQ
ncbi:MAG: hypothetical protein EBU77_08755 [Betaproteobacteria bacterium]|nr:hypothetical protein [Betaproteobacteria bacterium]